MKTLHTSVSFLLAVLALLVLPASGTAATVSQQLTAESTVEKALRRGTLRVGMSTFVPWAMQDKEGELIGFEIDVATRLAHDLGLEVEFVPTKWSGIIPALLTGKFDVVIGGMGIRPDRNLKVNFTIPYDHTGMAIVASRKLAADADSLEDFNTPQTTLAVRLGATSGDAAEKHMPEATLRQFDDESQAVQEVLTGRAHAFVSSRPKPAMLAARYPGKLFLPIEGTFTVEPIGFALRKGDVDSLNVFNNWIRVVEAEGWLAERRHYWFETRAWESRIK